MDFTQTQGKDVVNFNGTEGPDEGDFNTGNHTDKIAIFAKGGDDKIHATTTGNHQTHIYAGSGNDKINLIFEDITGIKQGHHVFADYVGSPNSGADTFNFQNISEVSGTIVGRLDDFDISRDTIEIEGDELNLYDLDSFNASHSDLHVRVVSYNGRYVGDADPQQWLLIENTVTGGYVFYALEGARIDDTGYDEAHFMDPATINGLVGGLAGLPDVDFVDPQNVVPDGETPEANGLYINDDDRGENVVVEVGGVDVLVTDVSDVIIGSGYGDVIAGGLNDDTIEAGAGNDKVWGGSGNDTIFAGTGADGIWGNGGDDVMHGGDGADTIHGGAGNDTIYGGIDYDTIYAGSGNDNVWGGNGRDTVHLGDGNDTFHDNDQNDANGIDTVYGGAGVDTIHGGGGADNLNGGEGDDTIWGGIGNDTIDGGNADDILHGQDGADTIHGGAGNDFIYGGIDYDTIYAGDGNDAVWGGNGQDEIHLGDGDDTFHDNGQNDLNGNDTVYGGAGADTINGGGGADELWGGDGNDTVSGGIGDDTIYGAAGADEVTGGSGADTFIFLNDHMIDWDTLSGSNDQKNDNLDVITDFSIGVDQIEFSNVDGVSGMGDLRAWVTEVGGSRYFTVQVRDTNERILVDVGDNLDYSTFFVEDNFVFG